MAGPPAPQAPGRSLLRTLRTLLPHILLLGAYVVYLCLGGVVFSLLEAPLYSKLSAQEHAKIVEAQLTKRVILDAYRNASMRDVKLDEANISSLLDSLIDTVDHPDWKAGRMKTLMIGRDWSFPSAVLFSMTTITTIGYGDLVPETAGGRAFCVIYSAIGVPFSFFLLADIGQVLAIAFIRLVRWCRGSCCRTPRVKKDRKVVEAGVEPKTAKNIPRRAGRMRNSRGRPNVTMRHLQSVRFSVSNHSCQEAAKHEDPATACCKIDENGVELKEVKTSPRSGVKLNTNNSALDQTAPASCYETTVTTVTTTLDEKKEPLQTEEKKATAREQISDDEFDDDYHADEVSVILVLLTLCGYIFISAFAFSLVEGWDYGTAIYFTFITLTTIGFGDVVPEEQYSSSRFFFCLLFTIFGLAVTSMCIALAQDRVSAAGKALMGYLGKRVRHREDEGEEEDQITPREADAELGNRRQTEG